MQNRSHFGLKMAIWYAEMERNRERMIRARETINTGKLSGAVGTFSFIDPSIETYVCRKLRARAGFCFLSDRPETAMPIFHDLSHHRLFLDKFSQEIRVLQRTEVREGGGVIFPPDRRALPPCLIKETPFSRKTFPGSPA